MNPIFLPQKLTEGGMCPCCGEEDFNKLKEENARKAKEVFDHEFPDAKCTKWEDGIYVADKRKRKNLQNEIRDAQILRDLGSTVYLVPESTRSDNTQYDAIVNGMKMELKNQSGRSEKTLKKHFIKSRKQASNVFINLENSILTKHKIYNILHAARNSPDYEKNNKFPEGGLIILKIRGYGELFYLDVNNI